ncbi:MAG: UPF0182 family protein, partial [Acidimicrobiia bacterium]
MIGLAGALAILLSGRGIATLYTDYLLQASLGMSGVWAGLMRAKIELATVFVTLSFALVWINLGVAGRLAPPFGPPGPEEVALRRVHALIDGRPRVTRLLTALLPALVLGLGASNRWNEWILFRNGPAFGVRDQ